MAVKIIEGKLYVAGFIYRKSKTKCSRTYWECRDVKQQQCKADDFVLFKGPVDSVPAQRRWKYGRKSNRAIKKIDDRPTAFTALSHTKTTRFTRFTQLKISWRYIVCCIQFAYRYVNLQMVCGNVMTSSVISGHIIIARINPEENSGFVFHQGTGIRRKIIGGVELAIPK